MMNGAIRQRLLYKRPPLRGGRHVCPPPRNHAPHAHCRRYTTRRRRTAAAAPPPLPRRRLALLLLLLLLRLPIET